MSSSTPLRLNALLALAEKHYNISVLTLMQNDILFQAIEELTMTEGPSVTPARILDYAQALVPKDAQLQQMYFQRVAALASAPIEQLESTAQTLATCAANLETVAARALARPPATMTEMEQTRQAIGSRYAQLISGARLLEEKGIISVNNAQKIDRLVGRPTGPLEPFYDKAIAIANAAQTARPKQRMAA